MIINLSIQSCAFLEIDVFTDISKTSLCGWGMVSNRVDNICVSYSRISTRAFGARMDINFWFTMTNEIWFVDNSMYHKTYNHVNKFFFCFRFNNCNPICKHPAILSASNMPPKKRTRLTARRKNVSSFMKFPVFIVFFVFDEKVKE